MLRSHLHALTRLYDLLWSAQSDQQLIGRLWRYMQRQHVLVYRLVIANSQDIFLNNVSFSKKEMYRAFMESPSVIRTSHTIMMLESH